MRSIWLLGGWMWLALAAAATTAKAQPGLTPPIGTPAPVGPATAPVGPAGMAGDQAPGNLAPAPTETRSYRWQVMMVDATSFALIASASRWSVVGASTYALGAPVLHIAHGEGVRAVPSVLLRVGAPVIGALVGGELWWRSQDPRCRAGQSEYCSDDEINAGVFIGFGVGVLSAMIVDAAFIARPVTVRRRAAVTWVPQVSATHDHVGLGVIGRF